MRSDERAGRRQLVARSDKTPWYLGPTLFEHLESVPLRQNHGTEALRFPVQSVIRPDSKLSRIRWTGGQRSDSPG